MKNRLFFTFIVFFSFFAFGKEFREKINTQKTLVYCSEGSPSFFNPQLVADGPSFDASVGIYDRLVEFDKTAGGVKPGLAKSWVVSKNQLSYTFNLRKKVAFHTTKYFKPTRFFNAEDVVFSFNRQRQKDHPYHLVNGGSYPYFNSLNMGALIKDIVVEDIHTVKFILNQKDATFLTNMAMEFSSILSKEYADYLLKAKNPQALDFRPIGTGPFVFKQYIKDSILRLIRNDLYFKKPVRIKGLIVAVVPDTKVRFQKLQKKECHIISQPSVLDIPKVKKSKKMRLVGGKKYNIAYLAMNVKKGPFRKLKVRKAVHHALNRDLYIKAIYQGYAEKAKNPYPPHLWSYNDRVKDYEYSVEKAKALLKEAGYEKGFKTTLWTLPISRPYNPNGKKMGELMQADLAKVGIKVDLVSYDWPTYISKSSKGEHGMIQLGWTSDNGDPDNFLRVLLSCDSVLSGENKAGWCFPPFDKELKKALRITDQKKRSRFYKKAQEFFKKQVPWVTLVHTMEYTAMLSSIQGYEHYPFGSKSFYKVFFKSK